MATTASIARGASWLARLIGLQGLVWLRGWPGCMAGLVGEGGKVEEERKKRRRKMRREKRKCSSEKSRIYSVFGILKKKSIFVSDKKLVCLNKIGSITKKFTKFASIRL